MIVDWYTDIHLNHCSPEALRAFYQELWNSDADAFFLTGDISDSSPSPKYKGITTLSEHLQVIESCASREDYDPDAPYRSPREVYFVLGNHDPYFSSVAAAQADAAEVSQPLADSSRLNYLTYGPPLELGCANWVVGHDGWYDGGPHPERFLMSDFRLIEDYKQGRRIWDVAKELSRKAAEAVAMQIKVAADQGAKAIYVLTHVPPFRACHFHEGMPGDDNANPWFTSEAMGSALVNASFSYPHVQFWVLCGHTHGPYDGIPYPQQCPNLHVQVGGATYGKPKLAMRLELDSHGGED